MKVCSIAHHYPWAITFLSLSLSFSLCDGTTDNFVCHHQGHRLLNNALVNVTEPTYIQCSAPYSGFDFIGRSDISPAKLPVLQPSPRDVAYHRLLIPLKCNCRDDTETMVLSGLRHGKNNSFPPFEFHVKWDCCPGKNFDLCICLYDHLAVQEQYHCHNSI